jgi:hypothetical protein
LHSAATYLLFCSSVPSAKNTELQASNIRMMMAVFAHVWQFLPKQGMRRQGLNLVHHIFLALLNLTSLV